MIATWIDRLSSSRLVHLADAVGKLAIFVAIISWFAEADARRDQRENLRREKLYRAHDILSQQTFLQVGGEIPSLALQDIVDEGVSLENIELTGGVYRGITLDGVNMSNADLSELTISDASLRNANLSGIEMLEVRFRDVDLTGADLTGAVLHDVDLSTTTGLVPAMLDGAAVCPDVRFPAGFDRAAINRTGRTVPRGEEIDPDSYWAVILRDCVDRPRPDGE